jgi:glycosyltransferase involved in cell wall biosynthesis
LVVRGARTAVQDADVVVRREDPSPSQAGFLERVRAVRALIFASIEEGFGLPPAEAFAVGTPAVWPRAASLPEIMDGLPGGYEPHSYEDFKRALSEVLALAPAELETFRDAVRSKHDWAPVAERVLRRYRELSSP